MLGSEFVASLCSCVRIIICVDCLLKYGLIFLIAWCKYSSQWFRYEELYVHVSLF